MPNFKHLLQKFPPSQRISIPAILIIGGTLLGIMSFDREIQATYRKSEDNYRNYVQISAGQTSRILEYLYRRSNIEDATHTIVSQLGSDPNLHVVMMIDDQNQVQLSNQYQLIHQSAQQTPATPYLNRFTVVRHKLAGEILLSKNRNQLIAIYPVLLEVLPNEIRPSRVGILFFEYDLTRTKKEAYYDALVRSLIFNSTLIIFCLGLWVFFEITLTRRASRLVTTTNQLAAGDLKARAELSGSDELVKISVAFDNMATEIEKSANLLKQQADREIILREITQKIRQSLDLKIIFKTATEEIREFINADRVAIFQFTSDSNFQVGEFVAESLNPSFDSVLNITIKEHCFAEKFAEKYLNNRIQIIDDLSQINLQECYHHLLSQFQIRSNIVIALINGDQLWGLLCIHQCSFSRQWQDFEINSIQQIANQLNIAIQQVNLFNRVQKELKERQQAEIKLQEINQRLTLTNEELARATRLKDQFLATMSHELRTPLNGILGMAEILQDAQIEGDKDEKQLGQIQIIMDCGNHLLNLINDILDVVKLEAEEIQLNCLPTSIKEVCVSSLQFVQQMASKKNITITTHIPSNLPDICLDKRRMRQVLINILNNAVKFTSEGGEVSFNVSVETAHNLANSPYAIRLAISDNGIGIAPENIDILFQPFIQIDAALNRKYEGTGLGLTLVEKIVKLHQGNIHVASELGVGSCFTIELPCHELPIEIQDQNLATDLKEQQREQPSKSISEEIQSAYTSTDKIPRILLVEDNRVNMITISRYLKASGYQVIVASNGQEGLEMAMSENPDLILMDIQMPIMDGFEAMQHIRQKSSAIANVPIIALTALEVEGDAEKCLQAGANKFLTKPIKLNQLTTMIQELLIKR